MPTRKDPLSGFFLSQICTHFISSWMANIIWRGYGPTFSQVHCPQFDYFPQPAAFWIVRCVPRRSESSVKRKTYMSQTEKTLWVMCPFQLEIFRDSCFLNIVFQIHFQFSFFLKIYIHIKKHSSLLLFFFFNWWHKWMDKSDRKSVTKPCQKWLKLNLKPWKSISNIYIGLHEAG